MRGTIIMQKKYWYRFLYVINIILIIGFCFRISADYLKYNSIENSAPFYAFILVRALEFLLLSSVICIIAKIIKKKFN